MVSTGMNITYYSFLHEKKLVKSKINGKEHQAVPLPTKKAGGNTKQITGHYTDKLNSKLNNLETASS